MKTLNVILADNQTLTRNGIINILTAHFGKSINITEVKNKDELTESLLKLKPDALIIDIELFDFNELIELSEIKKITPQIGILVVSDIKSPGEVMKVIDSGIKNYVFKTCEAEELLEALNATLISKKYFCNASMDIILEYKTAPKNTFDSKSLTSSEIAIVKLITQGLTTKEIAAQKNLSFHTIITHRKNIFRKLEIGNSSELLMYAIRAGIIDTTEYYI